MEMKGIKGHIALIAQTLVPKNSVGKTVNGMGCGRDGRSEIRSTLPIGETLPTM
jgi:hypothetical protein